VLLSDYDYFLPDELIAREPASPRDHSRLLRVNRSGEIQGHHRFYEITELLRPGDLLVLNNTKVLPARLFGKLGERTLEFLLLRKIASTPPTWHCLVKPGRKIRGRATLIFEGGQKAHVERTGEGTFQIEFPSIDDRQFRSWLATVGFPPLPPYLKREAHAGDRVHYQTVFACEEGSVAAPTAGLHFTQALLQKIRNAGIEVKEITLHVGYGTFAPLETLEQEKLHEETFEVPPETLSAMREARARGGRVIAVGTTSLRALESFAQGARDSTSIFIKPGYAFQAVDGLLTNFHLPQSSLMVLVAAFMGLPGTMKCYDTAVQQRYRFFSYGDAMLIL
jgi:S-adenosylmethionine:tRNA ribosyltransferase-isomerase